MYLEFKWIELTNFKAFAGGPHRFNLMELDNGLHFVVGENKDEPDLESNGGGKSSLISDALTWCLYGQTAAKLKHVDILPWSGKKPAIISICFAVDGTDHHLIRQAGPNKLILDSHECPQEDVENLVQMSFAIFTQAIIFGQGRSLFLDLEPSAKMALFVEILNAERWDELSRKASKEVDELLRLEAAAEGELEGLRLSCGGLTNLLSDILKKTESWSVEKNAQVKALTESLKEARKKQDETERERTNHDLIYDGSETELKALDQEHEIHSKRWVQFTEKRNKIAIHLASYQDEVKRTQRELNTLGKADACPTCGQSIKGTDLDKHKRELQKNITDYQETVNDVSKQLAEWEEHVNFTREQIKKINIYRTELKQKAETARRLLDIKTTELARITATANSIQEQIKALKEEENPYREQGASLRKQIKAQEADIEEIEENLKLLTAKIERTKFWVKGFKDIRLYVIEESLQELEITLNGMIEEVGLHDWVVKFDVERETKSKTVSRGLTTTIMSPRSKNDVKWAAWSGGEGQRLRVMGSLALAEVLLNYVGVQTNLEVLDEPTTFISGKGVQGLCEYLSFRADSLGKKIFLIDHVARQSSFFASTIKVVKTKEGAQIERV